MNEIQNPTNELWGRFDHIICPHFLPYAERMDKLERELKRVGIWQHPGFELIETVPNPYYQYICRRGGAGTRVARGHFLTGPKKINYQINFFDMMKRIQLKGWDKVLLLQDDVIFRKDLNFIKKVIDDTPADYDIVNYDPSRRKGWMGNGRGCWGKYFNLAGEEVHRDWDEETFVRYSAPVYHLSCVGLSKRAIDQIVVKSEEQLGTGDYYTWKDTGDLKTYCVSGYNNVCVQNLFYDVKMSDNVNMNMAYRGIDTSLFNFD